MIRKASPSKRVSKQTKQVPQKSAISEEQWNLPASFTPNGKLATLREVIAPSVHTLSLSDLTPEQTKTLVAARIEAQPKYDIMALGAGNVDKARAVAEVKAGSSLGQTLIEVEQRHLRDLVEHAQKTI
jgi:hypothetical protein